MKTVAIKEFVFATKDPHIASHCIISSIALQYYGGDTGILIHWTPVHHRRLSSERVKIDTDTESFCTGAKSPLIAYLNTTIANTGKEVSR